MKRHYKQIVQSSCLKALVFFNERLFSNVSNKKSAYNK